MDEIKEIHIEERMLEITMESDFQYDVSIGDNIKIETNDNIFIGVLTAINKFGIQLNTMQTIPYDEIRQITYTWERKINSFIK